MPGFTRWHTTARATSAPLKFKGSNQSLSTMPARFRIGFADPDASGRRAMSVSITRLSV